LKLQESIEPDIRDLIVVEGDDVETLTQPARETSRE